MNAITTPDQPTRRGLKIYKTNPFTDTTIVKTRKRSLTVDRGTAILAAKTGDEEATTTIAQVKEVDESQFVKLFGAAIGSYFDLTPASIKVFSLLLLAVQSAPNADKVWINPASAAEQAATLGKTLSAAVYHRGMRELVENKIIAHSVQPGWVFINPAVLFNGDRARFMLELRKRQATPALAVEPDVTGSLPTLTATDDNPCP
ncbi:MAG: hypothetical protein QJR02_03015 [Sinobacteraceae bacterium]|nr:hypothetical protein [Nevskiaceae bacterium]